MDANAPKLRVVIIGAGLAGLSTAVELLDQGYEVEIFDQRPHVGGKVASWQDKDGNHIEMGLHVFFGCYFNLFRLMAKCGAVENLLLKDHAHTFVNEGGDVRLLDFRFNIGDFKVGAPFHGLKAFFTTPQLSAQDKLQNALALGTSPVVRAVIDPEGGMQDVRKLDGISFEDWFMSHGMCPSSLGTFLIQCFTGVLCTDQVIWHVNLRSHCSAKFRHLGRMLWLSPLNTDRTSSNGCLLVRSGRIIYVTPQPLHYTEKAADRKTRPVEITLKIAFDFDHTWETRAYQTLKFTSSPDVPH